MTRSLSIALSLSLPIGRQVLGPLFLPHLAPEVNLAEGVEDGRAPLASAADGIVRQGGRGVRDLLEGSIQGGHGRYYPGGLQPGRWPIVPR